MVTAKTSPIPGMDVSWLSNFLKRKVICVSIPSACSVRERICFRNTLNSAEYTLLPETSCPGGRSVSASSRRPHQSDTCGCGTVPEVPEVCPGAHCWPYSARIGQGLQSRDNLSRPSLTCGYTAHAKNGTRWGSKPCRSIRPSKAWCRAQASSGRWTPWQI